MIRIYRSSLAYVADAGRWIVGMEDWQTKMEKRLAQIMELVMLANTYACMHSPLRHDQAKRTANSHLRVFLFADC